MKTLGLRNWLSVCAVAALMGAGAGTVAAQDGPMGPAPMVEKQADKPAVPATPSAGAGQPVGSTDTIGPGPTGPSSVPAATPAASAAVAATAPAGSGAKIMVPSGTH